MSYNSEDYFISNEFKEILNKFRNVEIAGNYASLDPDELIDVAEYYYNDGHFDRAEKIIDTAISIYPGSVSPLLFKARIEMLDKDDVSKAEYYTELIDDKTDLEYFYMKAEIFLYKGEIDKADKYLEKQFDIINNDDKDYFTIDSAALFFDYRETALANKWLKRTKDKSIIEYKEQEARILIDKGEYEKSDKLLNELLDQNPYSTHYWNTLASSQFFNNNIKDSIKSSEYSIAINPNNAEALLNKANGLYNLGNYNEALEYYTRCNKLYPDNENVLILMGLCCMMQEHYDEALVYLKKAEGMMPNDSKNISDAHKDLAWALCRLGRIDEGMAILDKIEDGNTIDKTILRGSLYLGCGNIDEAKKCYAKVVKDSDRSPEILNKMAISIFEAGYSEAAYKIFKMIYSSCKDWHDGYAYFAACCYDLGKNRETVDSLKLAAKYSPQKLKMLLGSLFPEGMPPKDYPNFFLNNMKNNNHGKTANN